MVRLLRTVSQTSLNETPAAGAGQVWDLLVIGAGPAGLTAALYGARAGLSTVVLERGPVGGQIAVVDRVENYPGFPGGLSGAELATKMEEQARLSGAAFVSGDGSASGLDLASPVKTVAGLRARAVIIATGARPRRLGLPGEQRLGGRGVSYCATCDGPFFRGRRVVVIGGGDSAVTEAIFLSRLAATVTVVHRRERFRAAPSLVGRLRQAANVNFRLGRVPVDIVGEERVEAVLLKPRGAGEEVEPERLEAEGVFIYVGLDPESGFVRGHVDLDDQGYIVTDEVLRTRVPRVYAAGDVRAKELRQVVTAAADGALAAMTAERDLAEDEA